MQMIFFLTLIKVYESKITKCDHRLLLYFSGGKKGILNCRRLIKLHESKSVGFKLENEQPTLHVYQLR